jgi:thiol-disulfide isomerase/thioredoxin
MTEVSGDGGAREPRKKAVGGKGLSLAILAVAAIGALAVLYVIVSASMKPHDDVSLQSLAKGGMAKLTVSDPRLPAPDAPFRDANGRPVSLKAFEGQVTVVNIWATWCGPCKIEMPTLARLQKAYAMKPVKVVAISIDREEDTEAAKAFIAQLGALPFYQDPKYAVPFAFEPKVSVMPTTILYGRDGKELGRVTGEAEWDGPEARAVIDWALKTAG